jgi:3-oxoacyl-[acyl-carrier-protein] synthase-1
MPLVCGAVSGDLRELPAELAAYDTRQARITWAALDGVVAAVAAASERWGPDRIGLVVGSSTGGVGCTEQAYAHRCVHGELPDDFDIDRRHAMHATLDVVRARTRITGPGWLVSTACSSSGKVFGSAARLLDAGLADAALVGGVDSLCQLTIRGFQALEVMSPDPCRPFCRERSGINLGEAGAFVLIERTGEGKALLLGVGESNDAYHMSAPHPEGAGARAAMAAAMTRARLDPDDVTFISAHGTGTRDNDTAEARAISALFGPGARVVATKGYTGHTLGAAGATEAVLSLLSIAQGFVPASLGAHPVDPELDVDVNLQHRDETVDVVLSNSFAFGGSNVAVAFGAPDR